MEKIEKEPREKEGHPVRLNDTKTPIWQVKAHEQWVKTVMLIEIVHSDTGNKVLELCVGTGLDIGKWARAKISSFKCFFNFKSNASEEMLKEAKERWVQKKQPFQASFIHLDPFKDSIDKALERGTEFDVVACFNGLENFFETRERAMCFIRNAASRLKTGGYFFGLLPDSSAIWYKAQKATGDKPFIKEKLISIDFFSDEFKHFGTKYVMKIEGMPPTHQYLVHFPSFIQLANEVGLNMLEITNLAEFNEDNKKNYGDLLKQLGVLNKQGKIEPVQKEIIGLFTTFCFQKIDL